MNEFSTDREKLDELRAALKDEHLAYVAYTKANNQLEGLQKACGELWKTYRKAQEHSSGVLKLLQTLLVR